jgi:hypothetical protein
MLRARLLLYFRIGRLGRVYTISTHMLNIWYGHVMCPQETGGKSGYATTGPPQTLRRQAKRLSRVGGRMLRSDCPDDDVEVVDGGVVG